MAQTDKFLYGCVARGPIVLAEYSPTAGESHKKNALECLNQLGPENKFYTLPKENNTYSFVVQDGFSYVAVSHPLISKETIMFFLDRIKSQFEAGYVANSANAQANSLDSEFGPKIKEAMDYIADNPQKFDKLEKIKAQERELKGLLADNLQKAVDRGEKISEITKKADDLKVDALEFQTVATAVKKKFWWENVKLQLILALIVLIIIAVIIVVIIKTLK